MTEFTSKYQSQRNFLKSRGSDSNRLYLSATIPLSIPRQKFWEGAMAFPNRTAPPPPPLCVLKISFTAISWESRCNIEIIVWAHF